MGASRVTITISAMATSGSAECAGSERSTQIAEGAGQRGHLVARGPSARVGQHPDPRARDGLVLRAGASAGTAEGDAIRANTDERDDARAVAADLPSDAAGAIAEFPRIQLVGARRRTVDQVRDAELPSEELAAFLRSEHAFGETSLMKGSPEPISRAGEMEPDRARPEARVDPDEEDPQIRCDDVRNARATRGIEVGAGRTPRLYRICPFGGGWQRGQRYMSSRPCRVFTIGVPQRGHGLPFRNRTCMWSRIFVPSSGGRPSSTSFVPRAITCLIER